MNYNIARLQKISDKTSRRIIGLMSGTSLDGLDIALCKITGSGKSTRVKLEDFKTVNYEQNFRDRVLEVFARQQIAFRALTELNAWIGLQHGEMINRTLRSWKVTPASIDAIASHGQTVFHAPARITPGARINSTLQIGDGDHLSVATGIITISDFRQKHIAAGGEGAPLAVYGDYLLFSDSSENRIMLNIGGIGNFTYLPASQDPKKVFVTDTGPGNTMIDQWVRSRRPSLPYDLDAEIALAGSVNWPLLEELLANDFFQLPFPKTTGPEQFNLQYLSDAQARTGTSLLSFEDVAATLTMFSARSVSEAIARSIRKVRKPAIYMSGGGAHNPLMVRWIKEFLPEATFALADDLGISGDAKEAVLFAVLANETLAGGKVNFGNRRTVPSVSMGKISFPA